MPSGFSEDLAEGLPEAAGSVQVLSDDGGEHTRLVRALGRV